MAIPNKRRADFIQKRTEQAYAAAEAGDGWVNLGKLWGCSNACALQWCQGRVPQEICAKIAANGTAARETGNYRKYNNSKPKVTRLHIEPRPANQFCARLSYVNRELHRCNAPTEGKTYCRQCSHEIAVKHSGSNYRNYAFIGVTG